MIHASAKFEVASFKEDIHLQENALFELDLGVKVRQNVAQYPLYHVTYAPATFEVAMYNSLEGDAFTRQYII